MKKTSKLISAIGLGLMVLSLVACGAGSAGAGGEKKGTLTFQTWDSFQKPGMDAMAAAYMEKNPDIKINVQVTSWDEYWTKLEAAGSGSTMPDIFWMHTNEMLKYADNGILADLSDLYADVDTDYYTKNFSEVSLGNAQGSDGKIYGVPKDKDTVGLIYNKEMFDQAGVAYPDDTWTWDDLIDASKKINEATGKYGYMAYADEQLGYWNFVYQAGGHILTEDKKQAGFTDLATIKAMEFYTNIQKEDFCPNQEYFAETQPGTAFFSGLGAMYFEGSWMFNPNLEQYPNMIGKWDVAALPKCPDPVNGDGRAVISNGLCYSTSAKGKNLELAKDFIKFLGTEEAMKIQGQSGAAIPAFIGLESEWLGVFDKYDYKINAQIAIDMMEYGVQSVNNASRPEWKQKVNDELLKIYTGESTLDNGLKAMQDIVDKASK